MATIKEEIMSIAEAQGYEGDGGSTIAEAVNALGSVMGGGGSGGGAAMVVTITDTLAQGGASMTYSADKTVEEIVEHIDNGGDVIAVYDQSMGAKASVFVYHIQRYGQEYVTFAAFDRTSSGSMTFYYMTIDKTDGVTMQQGYFTPSS